MLSVERKVFHYISANINGKKIKSYHWLRAITRLFRRKECDQITRVKSELLKLKRTNLDPSKVKKLYINESVCIYYKVSKIRYKKF